MATAHYKNCPKCGAPTDSLLYRQCSKCGIYYTKWAQSQQRRKSTVRRRRPKKVGNNSAFWEPWKRIEEPVKPAEFGVRLLALVVMLIWGIALIQTDFRVTTGLFAEIGFYSSFMGNVDLVFHEAGHVLFSFFGRFMTVLGGSLFQLLVPAALTLAFVYRYNNTFGAAATTWWLGFSCMDLAPYIYDAKGQQLLLLGGHTGAESGGSHDWNNLLRWTDSLESYETVATVVDFTGELLVILSVLWAGYLLWRQFGSLKKLRGSA